MGIKTLSDCKQCPHLTECDAHISNGTHRHDGEPDPCELILKPIIAVKKIKIFKNQPRVM
jgi:hypothetical protein